MKRTTVIYSLGLLTLLLVVLVVVRSHSGARILSQAEFNTFIRSNLLAKVRIHCPPKPGQVDGIPAMLYEVRGMFYQTDARGQILEDQGTVTESPFIARVQITDEQLVKLTSSTNFAVVTLNPLVAQAGKWLHLSKP